MKPARWSCSRRSQRDPAHHARIRVVAGRLARLPDALIGLAPVVADEVAELAHHRLRLARQAAAAPAHLRDRLDQLAVAVELQLAGGARCGCGPDASPRCPCR